MSLVIENLNKLGILKTLLSEKTIVVLVLSYFELYS